METIVYHKDNLSAKFRQAGASPENRVHIITWKGKWLVMREGSQRSLGSFESKEEAKVKANHYLQKGKVEAVVVHHPDGSVEDYQTLAS